MSMDRSYEADRNPSAMVTVTLLLDRDLGPGHPAGLPRGPTLRHRPSRSGGDAPRDIRLMGGNMVRARLPGMASERAIWAGETIGRRLSLSGNWPEEGMLPVVLVTGSGRPQHDGRLAGSVSASAERSSAARGDQGAWQRC